MTLPVSCGPAAPVAEIASSDDRRQLVVGQLGRQVARDQLGLGLLGLGALGVAARAVRLGGLEAALALAAKHGDLVVAAGLEVLLEGIGDQAQRADAGVSPAFMPSLVSAWICSSVDSAIG